MIGGTSTAQGVVTVARILRAFGRALGSIGHAMVPVGAPYDVGFALPRPDYPPLGHPADRLTVPLSGREREAFHVLAADLAL
ncbi:MULTISPECIES: hypothetical protein [Amycolatopsis]|uniref:Uncharacterized protein n=1 Tax=Amycolatopsis thermoflava TaxID=84480 RepID=A0A3N2H8M0_9PSEU|nr:hypothetical protein [Amycolatopsis thermoflava]ROS45204.1 hypothetical protein EDD35_7667 [Amycolatopsis thermoflava]